MIINQFFKKETITKKTTFYEYVDFYIKNIARLNYSEITLDKNIGVIKSKLLPTIGNKRLEEITPIFVTKFLNDLSKKTTIYKKVSNHTLSFQTVHRIKAIFSAVMQSAVELGIIDSNPCRNLIIKYIKDQSKPYKVYDIKTYLKVLKLLKKEDLLHRAVIELALKTGLRKSEIFALTWEDINFENNTINVNKSRNYLNGYGMIVKTTKNKSSNRIICISDNLSKLLMKLKNKYYNSMYIFEKLNFNTITLWFRNWQLKNNIEPLKFHDLRHTHATLLLSQGIDIKTISTRLGHSSITTTLNIYTHALDTLDKSAAEKLEKIK